MPATSYVSTFSTKWAWACGRPVGARNRAGGGKEWYWISKQAGVLALTHVTSYHGPVTHRSFLICKMRTIMSLSGVERTKWQSRSQSSTLYKCRGNQYYKGGILSSPSLGNSNMAVFPIFSICPFKLERKTWLCVSKTASRDPNCPVNSQALIPK